MLDEIWIHSQAKKLGFNKFKKSNGDSKSYSEFEYKNHKNL